MMPTTRNVFTQNSEGGFDMVREYVELPVVFTSIPSARTRSQSVISTASSHTLCVESLNETQCLAVVKSIPNAVGEHSEHTTESLHLKEMPQDGFMYDLHEEEETYLMEEVDREIILVEERPREPLRFAESRNLLPILTHNEVHRVHSFNWNGFLLKIDTTIELLDGDFLQIKAIIQDVRNNDVIFRGWHLKRCSNSRGMLEKKLNEVYYIFDVDLDDLRTVEEQAMIESNVNHFLAVRQLISSNIPRPKNPFIGSAQFGKSERDNLVNIRETGILWVRRKYIRVWPTAKDRVNKDKFPNRFVTCKFVNLSESECLPQNSIPSDILRTNWRGKTKLGGSAGGFVSGLGHMGGKAPQLFDNSSCPESMSQSRGGKESKKRKNEFHLSDQTDRSPTNTTNLHRRSNLKGNRKRYSPVQHSRYTYGDTFSGGGGSCRGAKEAGLAIRYVMDGCNFCIKTLTRNFPEAKVYHTWTDKFATLEEDLRVDILHLSPPCQIWSPAHTRPGINDEQNFASLFAVMALVSKVKPRIVTLEQTFGIMARRFEASFNSLIHCFTSLNYSVSWQIVQFKELGLPQNRRRLIIFAAGPGEVLPDFPEMTHSENSNLGRKTYTTPRDVLQKIPRNAPNHRIAKRRFGVKYRRWDDLQPINCITTSKGVHWSHPRGRRALTDRELASLSGFPLNHIFFGKEISKQIGNAVPPSIAKIWFTHILSQLERADALELAARNRGVIKIDID